VWIANVDSGKTDLDHPWWIVTNLAHVFLETTTADHEIAKNAVALPLVLPILTDTFPVRTQETHR
jgi:hypothetical protein